MSKKENNSPKYPDGIYAKFYTNKEQFESNIPQNVHRLIADSLQRGVDRLEGDVLTLIEMLGLPEQQERATKAQFRKAYNERYRVTTDILLDICFALMQSLTPEKGESLSVYTSRQNPHITGWVAPEEIS